MFSWSVGTALPSDRSSHCAVGLGNGSIIVTGGYGALNNVQRFDINTGTFISTLFNRMEQQCMNKFIDICELCAWIEIGLIIKLTNSMVKCLSFK